MSGDPRRKPDLGTVARIKQQRRRLTESGPRRQRNDGDFDEVALPHADSDALRDLLVAAQARAVIEIGLAYGASALAIAEALAVVDQTSVAGSTTQPELGNAGRPIQIAIDAYQATAYHNVARATL
ncbi:MAG: hypothetical protein ACR2QO_15745, partial [Acidimicrobiales bacterium]